MLTASGREYSFTVPLSIIPASPGDTIGLKIFARDTGSGAPKTDSLNFYPDVPPGTSPVYSDTRVTVPGNYEHIVIPSSF